MTDEQRYDEINAQFLVTGENIRVAEEAKASATTPEDVDYYDRTILQLYKFHESLRLEREEVKSRIDGKK